MPKNANHKKEFDYEVDTLIKKGQRTIQDVSIIEGLYKDFVLLKNGYLTSILKVSGINLDLLAEYEQNRIFEDYGSFLMSQVHDQMQTISMTVPVDLRSYTLGWKKRYLNEVENKEKQKNDYRRTLIASYIDHYQGIRIKDEMSTKQHFVVVRERIKKRTLQDLEGAESILTKKVEEITNSLRSTFESYDLTISRLSEKDMLSVLYRYFDFEMSKLYG
ncbi:TrsD/TraD family conjugative transfer protein [Fictibacillus terranigra]|uniref:TrsD/TraD family conjugative transfer protein n=1 Tax=Fictibacillus terranigra TaxID=3058424 RepID=A0ABT8EC79_9BACL|nr:TrsD/TraD family conjugative transfer protein [Fictibacillus sp. CENA-BCM004]MDN4075501.1 TrsD/TraD family conjugative transfer protein [Fictibacillus sp. CENA-BCM004]